MKRTDFYYELPEELIAQSPAPNRADSRLMVIDRNSGRLLDRRFYDIVNFLREGDCLVLNDTRVLPARLLGVREDTGGAIEIFLLKRIDDIRWETLVKPGRRAVKGRRFVFGGGRLRAEIEDVLDDANRIVRFEFKGDFMSVLDAVGSVPLPPYIKKAPTEEDRERYQTVYAKNDGSAAAPTAGLHFTPELLDRIEKKGVDLAYITLHVGLGTFRPVKEENIEDHRMHTEYYNIPPEAAEKINAARDRGGRVVAVGTTSCRTLETAAGSDGRVAAGDGSSGIFIYPGYRFKTVDALITNFHLPESTLLMLVSALAGRENMLAAYRHAIEERYRFFSYGDASFITDDLTERKQEG